MSLQSADTTPYKGKSVIEILSFIVFAHACMFILFAVYNMEAIVTENITEKKLVEIRSSPKEEF